MGFCLFNNIALAAYHALEVKGLQRIMILDWDAHHGNATEHMFYEDPRVLFVSWHQYPNWPGTGAIEDMGTGKGTGYNVNIPLPVNYGDNAYLQTFKELVIPLAANFKPQLLLVSAGYDAHFNDPLTHMGLTAKGFAELVGQVITLASQLTSRKVGFLLEGGYHLEALAWSVYATLMTLAQEQIPSFQEPTYSNLPPQIEEKQLKSIIERIQKVQPLLQGT